MYLLIRLPDDDNVDFLNHPLKAEDILVSDRNRRVRLFETILEADEFREELEVKCLIIS